MKNIALITAIANIGRKIARFARKVWDDHVDLLDRNPAYRRQLETGVVAILGACALHPTVALVTTVVVTLFVAAHESGVGPWRPGYSGPVIRRPDEGEWDF